MQRPGRSFAEGIARGRGNCLNHFSKALCHCSLGGWHFWECKECMKWLLIFSGTVQSCARIRGILSYTSKPFPSQGREAVQWGATGMSNRQAVSLDLVFRTFIRINILRQERGSQMECSGGGKCCALSWLVRGLLGYQIRIWVLGSESPTTVYSMGLHPPSATYCVILGKLLNLSVLWFPLP